MRWVVRLFRGPKNKPYILGLVFQYIKLVLGTKKLPSCPMSQPHQNRTIIYRQLSDKIRNHPNNIHLGWQVQIRCDFIIVVVELCTFDFVKVNSLLANAKTKSIDNAMVARLFWGPKIHRLSLCAYKTTINHT